MKRIYTWYPQHPTPGSVVFVTDPAVLNTNRGRRVEVRDTAAMRIWPCAHCGDRYVESLLPGYLEAALVALAQA
jgi:hypothetical protein